MSHLVTFRLDADTLALLDREAKRTRQSRSEAVRSILRTLLVGKLPAAKPTMRIRYDGAVPQWRKRALGSPVPGGNGVWADLSRKRRRGGPVLPALPHEGR